MTRALVIGVQPQSLTNFRGDLIRALRSAGVRVTAMAEPAPPREVAAIEALGCDFRPYPVRRNSLAPAADVQTLRALRRAVRETKPDLVLAYTIKPVIWGGLALRGVPDVRFLALITGLGFAFQGEGLSRRALTELVVRLYRAALWRADAVIFQNTGNRDEFLARRIVPAEKCHIVDGSGVDTGAFAVTPLSVAAGTRFLLIARLLGEKGIREYVEAAAIVRARHPATEFHLVGPADPSPDGIPLPEVEGWHAAGTIRYHGEAKDVRPFIAESHIYVLPSYHEGMPRTVLEAMAMGRPILTTDVPGCRETVVQAENGWLVPKADAKALAERMIWFIENRDQWERMGAASRRIAVERFDVRKINAEMLRIMGVTA